MTCCDVFNSVLLVWWSIGGVVATYILYNEHKKRGPLFDKDDKFGCLTRYLALWFIFVTFWIVIVYEFVEEMFKKTPQN
jgi:hypothetical protein